MNIIIDAEWAEKPLLWLLKQRLGFSTKMITRLKQIPNGITVNGQWVTVRYPLQAGDIVSLQIQDTEEETPSPIRPIALPLDIIYEDENVLLVNKPPQMPTHPSHGHYEDTLANAVAHYYAKQTLCLSSGQSLGSKYQRDRFIGQEQARRGFFGNGDAKRQDPQKLSCRFVGRDP